MPANNTVAVAQITLTAAQIKTGHSVPINIPGTAPGPGKWLDVIDAVSSVANGSNPWQNESIAALVYTGMTTNLLESPMAISYSSDIVSKFKSYGYPEHTDRAEVDGLGLTIIADEDFVSDTGNGTTTWSILYRVCNL